MHPPLSSADQVVCTSPRPPLRLGWSSWNTWTKSQYTSKKRAGPRPHWEWPPVVPQAQVWAWPFHRGFAGRVLSLRFPPWGTTGAWGTQGLHVTSGGSRTPPPRALSFCTCRDGQGTLRVESIPGWAGLPRAKGPQKLQPCLDTPEPPPSSSPHPSLCLHGDWHRSGLMGPEPQLRWLLSGPVQWLLSLSDGPGD